LLDVCSMSESVVDHPCFLLISSLHLCLTKSIVQVTQCYYRKYLYYLIAGADFTAGRYTATFTSGATTATTSIPIVADDIDEPTEQFSLRLYIDGDGYGRGLQKGGVAEVTVNITQSKYVCGYHCSVMLP